MKEYPVEGRFRDLTRSEKEIIGTKYKQVLEGVKELSASKVHTPDTFAGIIDTESTPDTTHMIVRLDSHSAQSYHRYLRLVGYPLERLEKKMLDFDLHVAIPNSNDENVHISVVERGNEEKGIFFEKKDDMLILSPIGESGVPELEETLILPLEGGKVRVMNTLQYLSHPTIDPYPNFFLAALEILAYTRTILKSHIREAPVSAYL